MGEPKTQVEEAKEQIRKLLDSVKDAEGHLDPHALAAAKAFGEAQTEFYLERRDRYWKFMDDLRSLFFKKNYGPEEKK